MRLACAGIGATLFDHPTVLINAAAQTARTFPPQLSRMHDNFGRDAQRCQQISFDMPLPCAFGDALAIHITNAAPPDHHSTMTTV